MDNVKKCLTNLEKNLQETLKVSFRIKHLGVLKLIKECECTG